MDRAFLNSICRRSGVPELYSVLTERLSASDLNSLLLEVYHAQTQALSPAQVLAAYRKNRFVQPSAVDAVAFRELELYCLKLAQDSGFTPLELAPVSPLGACSAIGTVHQNKVLSATRGTEVTADCTNVLALESSRRRISQKFPTTPDRYCCAHRHIRTVQPSEPGFTPHFGLFCLSSAGRDSGNFLFEKTELARQIGLYMQVLQARIPNPKLTIILKSLNEPNARNRLFESLEKHIRAQFPEIPLEVQHQLQQQNQYYRSLQFGIVWNYRDNAYPIIDGGFTDWTQQLCNNKKERFLASGIGLEFLWKVLRQDFSG